MFSCAPGGRNENGIRTAHTVLDYPTGPVPMTEIMPLTFRARTIMVAVEVTTYGGENKAKDKIGRVSLAPENEVGAVGSRRSIFSMLTYRTLFCFWL